VSDRVVGNDEDADPESARHGDEDSNARRVALGATPRRLEARLALAVFLVAAALAHTDPRDNENRTLDLVRALARGKLTIDAWAENTLDRAFVVGDRVPSASLELSGAAPAPILAGEHIYSGGAPGLAFALLPVHSVMRRVLPRDGPAATLVLVLAGAALPLALGTVGVRRALLGAGADEAVATTGALVHALATIALPFGTRLYAHALVVALIAWSLAALLPARRPALAGLLAGCAVACDYSAALPAGVLFLLSVERSGARGALAFLAGALPPAAGLGAYHAACFGSPWATPYDHRSDASTRELLATGAYGFSLPSPRILVELVAGERRGMLFTEPAALLGFVGLAASARTSRPRAFALAGALAVLLANAARLRDWSAGFSFGPRYAASALPFLALGYPRGLELAGRAGKVVVAASAFLAFAGATTEWTFSVPGTLEELLWSGGGELRTVALAFALWAVAGALVPLRDRWTRLALGLIPLVAWTPHGLVEFVRGPKALARARAVIVRHEHERAIESARDAREARARLANVELVFGDRDPALVLEALDRVVELDPEDRERRDARDRLRADLGGGPR
jgi:hypothetical protein